MSHSLIIGMTESGKTTLAKLIVKQAKKRGVKTAILDPLKDPHFGADFHAQDGEEFLVWAKRNKSAVLVIDEAGTAVGRYNVAMQWVVTTARHLGHSSVLVCQGASQLSPLIRGQCTTCYLFACTQQTIKVISEDFNTPELMKLPRLSRGEFFIISRYDSLRHCRVDFASGKIVEVKPVQEKLDFEGNGLDNRKGIATVDDERIER